MKSTSLVVVLVGAVMAASCSSDQGSPANASGTGGSCDPSVIAQGQTCNASTACPAGCDDGNACTVDTCDTACVHTAITACAPGDGCCPSGCSTVTDSDCLAGTGGAMGTGGDSTTGGTVGTGGADNTGGTGGTVVTCDESTISTSPNTLTVSVDTAQQVIHKEIFGTLMEILGNGINGGLYVGSSSAIPNTQGIRNDIIDGFKEAGIGAIEWPGGCAANGYDWKANTSPSGTMGTDLFMEFCKWVDAEPYLVGRPDSTYAASNKEWIDYVNNNPDHPDWNLKYFKVGNEVWGCGGNLGDDEATYEGWYNANYSTLSTPVNGKELFLVGATGGIWTVSTNSGNWLTTMLSPGHLADKINGIEIHDYVYFPDTVPCVGFSEDEYYDIVDLANEGQIGPRLDTLDTILNQYDASGNIKIMEDEWGDWLKELNPSDTWFQQVTLMDAISAAEQLHLFMKHADRVLMAGIAQPINVIHSLFLTNSSSGGTDLVKTPTFYVFKMFVAHHTQNAKWAPNTLSSEDIMGNGKTFPVLSSGATVNDAGQVNVSLANVDLVNSRDITITLDTATTDYAVASAQVITGQAKDSYNDFGQTEAVNLQPLADTEYQLCGRKLKVTLPSKSVVMFSLNPL